MAGSIYGTLFRLSTFGESHGKSIGGILDGCPAGFDLDLDFIQSALNRRKPGQSKLSTERNEADDFEILSGLFEGKTTGTPIAFVIENNDARSKDYSDIKDVYRPSHADYTYHSKYGLRDYRGGGRASARETAVRVIAGAIAQQMLLAMGIEITAWVHRVKDVACQKPYQDMDRTAIENNLVRCPEKEVAGKMEGLIETAKVNGDSLGGAIKCVVTNMPVGLGEPVFDKLNAELAKAIFSINAVKYFELGAGKEGTYQLGSTVNDEFVVVDGNVETKTNHSGGIQGGISNGEDVVFEVGFKPVATIRKEQNTINTNHEPVTINVKGRHDPCVLPRAVPIVEAMTALVMMDFVMRNRSVKWSNIKR